MIEIEGEMTLNLPPFVTVAHDAERQTANVSIEDSNLKHQRSMWGMSALPGICDLPNVRQEPPDRISRITFSVYQKAIFAFYG